MFGGREDSSTRTVLNSLGISVVASLATQAAVVVFEKVLSSKSYSQADVKRLNVLKSIYTETLGRPRTPVFWDLDDHNRPIYHIRDYEWPNYVRSISQNRNAVGNYHYQSSLLADDIATYLSERSKRWFGRGSPDDVSALCMGELIDFALNELPTLRYDEASIQKIKQRIKYIERVQDHPFLFKFGWLTPKRNKSDTLESVRQELIGCVNIVKKESQRECAREKFKIVNEATEGLLLATVRSVYYARATVVHNEAINLTRYMDLQNQSITSSSKQLYSNIQKTHTGRMLLEVMSWAGLRSFGAPGEVDRKPIVSVYFNRTGVPPVVDWRSRSFDLPPWLQEREHQIDYLRKTRKIMQHLLRIAELKKLVEEAYDLTGKVGELWAYGDQQGRLSLEALLFLLGKELTLFFGRYDEQHQLQNKKRKIYVLKHRMNPNENVNINFNKVDEQHETVNKFYQILQDAINDIKERMLNFSEDEIEQVNHRKKSFYESVSSYMKQYYPKDYSHFQTLEEQLSQEDSDPAFGLDKPLFEQNGPSQQSSWNPFVRYCLGKGYPQWKEQYFNQHRDAYLTLAKLLRQFERGKSGDYPLRSLITLAQDVQEQIAEMERNVILERPVWRFSLGRFSAGWPFNQRVRHYLDRVSQEFRQLSQGVEKAVEERRQKREKQQQSSEMLSLFDYNKRQEGKPASHYLNNNGNPFFQEPVGQQEDQKESKQASDPLLLSKGKNIFTVGGT